MQRWINRTFGLAASLGLILMFSGTALAQYTSVLLDSNVNGHGRHVDPLLVNGWGLAYLPGQAFWVADAGSGWSTLYDGKGNPQSLQVIVPAENGLYGGSPTGIVANSANEFLVKGWPSYFIFATLDGTISGWSPISNPTEAIIAVDNSSTGASYTGLAITNRPSGNMIYAADTANGKVDMYDGNFHLVKSFTDPSLPKNAVPFGIQDIKGKLLVAYCDASGGPGGVIDVFTEDGTFVKHFTSGAPLNQPWGMALAPGNFGPLSNTLLVSNNLDVVGDINGFDIRTGKFVGTVSTPDGKPILIDQIWGIEFGGGTAANGKKNNLYWAAGPVGNVDGAFGVIVPN
ncbi:MAG: TIGR03118 family protein [Terriglobales bacterium]